MANTALTKSDVVVARQSYHGAFRAVDEILVDAFRKPSSTTLTKVILLERVYSAGIQRKKLTEQVVAKALDSLEANIHEMVAYGRIHGLNRTSLPTLVSNHADLTRDLFRATGTSYLYSFVSKYLHFHSEAYPIFDSRVEARALRMVNTGAMTRAKSSMVRPSSPLKNYYRYAVRFLLVYEDAQSLVPGTTVKEVDHLLWS